MSGKLPSCQLLDDRMLQYDSLFPEAQRRINTGEEGAAAVLFGRLSEYLGEATTIRAFTGLCGTRGWLYMNWAWRVRGALDRLCGGVGLRRGRRDADSPRPPSSRLRD